MKKPASPGNSSPKNSIAYEVDKLLKARMSLGHLMSGTMPLSGHDYELIGKFVQTYCVADLESRRVINCLIHISEGKPRKFALTMNDKDVLQHLIACSDSCVWNIEVAEGVRKAADIFVQHRHIRHMFAHWAGRRIPNHDAFIFFTSSLGQQKLPHGAALIEEDEDANVQFGIVEITGLLVEQAKLEEHAQYISNIGRQLEPKVMQIADQFAKDVANGKLIRKPYIVPTI